MQNRDSVMAHSGTLETLQSHHGPSRRTRPPNLDLMAAEEHRVPLRPDKVNRRESRLGLRNIFSRTKAPREPGLPLSPLDIPKSLASRTSVADMNNWTFGQSATSSDHTPTTPRSPRILSTMFENSPSGPPPVKVIGPAKPARGPLAIWSPPPLFKAFPQAIKHMTLPAASLPTEVILRIHERRANVVVENPIEQTEQQTEKLKSKKRHRRNTSGSMPKFEWTNKIYVLATSGYLLQYGADGPFDRLPEKVLHLGKNSAAFASDVIPGRHWVIQVSSLMESDGTATPDSRSLFSRMTFRAAERRQAANFLMVFDTAEDMESWLAALRHEIEILGGKKTLTETGKPKAEDEAMQLREQPSQRTLVVRDPERLSRILPHNFGWQDAMDNDGSATTVTDHNTVIDQSLDDISTTNSFVSHDGRQLDNLRDSSNRLSFISSGQRTIVTSAGSSSPEPSPTVETFPTHFDEKPHHDTSHQIEARPRPNAAAILDRRQSMQVMTPFVDLRGGPVNLRPMSNYATGPMPEPMPSHSRAVVTPNFSVPKSSNRRFSYMRSQELGMTTQPVIRETESLPRLTARKSPPTTLAVARPLSMVADQPSPMETVHVRPATRHGEETQPPRTSEEQPRPLTYAPITYDLPSRRSSLMPLDETRVEINRPVGSRRLSTMRPWQKHDHSTNISHTFTAPMGPVPTQRARSRPSLPGLEEMQPRCRSSLDLHASPHSETSSVRTRSRKRASMQSVVSEHSSRFSISGDLPVPLVPESLPEPPPPPSAPLPPIPTSTSNPQLRADAIGKASLAGRRSMPQLNDGPPPAPPPTCALPPIPQRISAMI
ncbi:hypothetical protein BGZ61DRAFT_341642 [Ilyonectria robusta]|uniref:uncharacterized protein n=1 Tax=Ilyonectria robusta TaxID=1079257 RepID=UPI001E8CC46F|nr:uncharacterized protein BGZ61DRAFT_341642 [Ilyonectria robusta]KAH8735884.1 hypothetical protein BGZ61DRAFT_341642 [Ilyonectria robusta]